MRDQPDTRLPEEIESDIARTRADFSSTIEAIQSKLTPSELMDQAVDYALTTTPGAFSANLVNSVRRNPIPIAMIGVGIAWLMAANRRSDVYASRSRHRHDARRTVYRPGMDGFYDGASGANHMTGSGTGGSSDGVLQRAASLARETGHDLRDKASDVGQRLSGSASAITDRAQQLGQSAQERLQESAEGARARVNELGQQSQAQFYRAKDQLSRLLDEQPLVVGALGIAIGAALGATLPNTRRENELMGRTRDDLLGRAKETALEQVETVKQSAQRVAETVKETAKQEAERFKEEAGAGIQGKDQTRPVSSGIDGSQFSTPGQQLPH